MADVRKLMDAIRAYVVEQAEYSVNAHEIDFHKDEHDGPGLRTAMKSVRAKEDELEAALKEALG